MFMGITAHKTVEAVADYDGAMRVFEKARQDMPKEAEYGFPLGKHYKSVTWVRQDEDGTVRFRLYSTDVVVWHPDNSFTIDNFGSVTTSQFACHFTPWGVHLHHPSRDGGHCGISYTTNMEGNWWSSRHMCHGDVRFRPHDDVWLPDEDTCDEIRFPVITGSTRAVAKKYHLREFENWMMMAPTHLRIEHNTDDMSVVLEALEHRDFRLAAMHLPTTEDKESYGRSPRDLGIIMSYRSHIISPACLPVVRAAAYYEEGVVTTKLFHTIAFAELEKHQRMLKTLGRSNVLVPHHYGLQR